MLRHFVCVRREEIAAGKLKRPRPQQRPPASAASTHASADEAGASGQPGGMGEKPPWTPYKPSPDIRILEGLAASGLRSIRYALEVGPSLLRPSHLLLTSRCNLSVLSIAIRDWQP